MPGVAPAVVLFVIVTVVPWPIDGVTGFGEYVIGGLDVNVPSVIGFWASPVSPSVGASASEAVVVSEKSLETDPIWSANGWYFTVR